MMSMLRHAVARHPQRPVTLVQSARTLADLAYADEIRVIERRFPHVRWVPAVSGERVAAPYHPGRINEALLRATVPDLPQSVVCMCGPSLMMDHMRALLRDLAFPAARCASSGSKRPSRRSAKRRRAPTPTQRQRLPRPPGRRHDFPVPPTARRRRSTAPAPSSSSERASARTCARAARRCSMRRNRPRWASRACAGPGCAAPAARG